MRLPSWFAQGLFTSIIGGLAVAVITALAYATGLRWVPPVLVGLTAGVMTLLLILVFTWLTELRRQLLSSVPRGALAVVVIAVAFLFSSAIAWRVVETILPGVVVGTSQRPTTYFKSWGFARIDLGLVGPIIIDGHRLSRETSVSRVAVVCFHHMAIRDVNDEILQKSRIFDVQDGDMAIVIQVDDAFKREFSQGQRITAYVLLSIPRNVTIDEFSTLRQANVLGVRTLGAVGGPP